VVLDGDHPAGAGFRWYPILRDGVQVGDLTNCVWSYRLRKNIGFALISTQCRAGERVQVAQNGAATPGTLTELPFVR
jgi:aminomethyltransferase